MTVDHRVSPEQLHRYCDPGSLPFASTAELPDLQEIIGQERATRAIEFGTGVRSFGYNIYVMGPPGAGKTTTVTEYLRRRAESAAVPSDWLYVHNFLVPYRPNALQLPAGRGRPFQRAMEQLVRSLGDDLPRAYESDLYREHASRLRLGLDQARNEHLRRLQAFAEERGFAIVRTPSGLAFAPSKDGKLLEPEQIEALPPAEQQRLEAGQPELQEALERTLHDVREVERGAKRQQQDLDRDVARSTIAPLLEPIIAEFGTLPEVAEYLEQVRNDIVENAESFKSAPEDGDKATSAQAAGPGADYVRYQVNVAVDNSQRQGAPIVLETSPSFFNLMGRVEHRAEMGALVTDHTMIRPGSLHTANGGYLVVEVAALLRDPSAWEALKRCLRQREIRIESVRQDFSAISTTGLTPEPIPLDVKVILVGDVATYYLLYAADPDFQKLFKVRADFAVDMEWSPTNVGHYAAFIARRCREEGLLHFDATGVAKVVEYGARLASDTAKLSTQFSLVGDVVSEAAFWAQQEGHQLVTGADVCRAVEERVYRASQMQERVREAVTSGTICIDTAGAVVGQVNGLAVLALGDHMFGQPSRITASVYMGERGLVNIEREAKLSGPIHDKGMLILTGYLGGKYAHDNPLSLSAAIAFEQSYDGIDGDSASSTELYALLSALSGAPIKQGIAVTGSVDQRGQVQPIGGLCEKVEGFYDVCRAKGLSGEQGVLMPRRNLRQLMLRDDVVEAVRQGQFHLWAVDSIDEGIEILTGVPAGAEQQGEYPDGSIHGLAKQHLRRLTAGLVALRGNGLHEAVSATD
ncbi:MAG: Lon protease family protein [Anaerolineae bacterium]